VEAIIKAVANAQATKQLSTTRIRMLLHMYLYWTKQNILPEDGVADNVVRDLFNQTQSHRLRKLFEGKFLVKVLDSLAATPYRYDLSSEAVQGALDVALAESSYLSEAWDKGRKSFIERLAGPSEVVRLNTTVHAELAMIKTMVVEGKMKDVLTYVGVSKLSCIMCSHYIRDFNGVMKENIVLTGRLTLGGFGQVFLAATKNFVWHF
jgi:OTT_1508-like deaminase